VVRIFGCNSGDPAFGSAADFLCCLGQALKPLCAHVSRDDSLFILSFLVALSCLEDGVSVPTEPMLT